LLCSLALQQCNALMQLWVLASALICYSFADKLSLFHVCICCPMLLQVVPAAGVVKDAEWVQGLHEAAIMQLSDGNPHRCLGTNMDGTSVNRKAMRDMEEQQPSMVNMPCQAHCLDLIIKDLGNGSEKEGKKTMCGAVLQTAVKLAGAVGESKKLRALVNKAQIEKYEKVRTTAHHATVQHSTVLHSTTPLSAVQLSTVLPSTARGSTAQHTALLFSTAQHSTALC
jgi:hypothetical protein